MRVFQRVVIPWCLLVIGCGGEAELVPIEYSESSKLDEVEEPEPPTDHLCIDEELLLGSDIVLLDADLHPWCEPLGQELDVTVRKEWPQRVVLYGELHIEYCIEVQRESGYITISHERGVVQRNGDLFTWCITTHTGEPEEMTLMAFTPEAKCQLWVP